MIYWINKTEAPFKPEVKSEDKLDVSNFDAQYTLSEAKESIIETEEREKIINKTKAYSKDFDQIANS